jgi:hypothetical protein
MRNFNLWRDPWMISPGGLVSIRDALTTDIAWVRGQTPLETAGILRLLAAILQDIARPRAIRDVLEVITSGLDADALARWERQYQARLDLFGERPFFQAVADDILPALETDKQYKAADTVARLCPDIPTGTSVARNGERDEAHLFCPACAARALTVPGPLYGSGGSGFMKSINGVPPLYAYPRTDNLLSSLAYCLAWDGSPIWAGEIGYDDPAVPWRFDGFHAEKRAVASPSLLHGLTWQPRRIRFYPEGPGRCTRCGASADITIRKTHFSPGERFEMGDDKQRFADPFVVMRAKTSKTKSWSAPVIPPPVPGWHEFLLGAAMVDQSAIMGQWATLTTWTLIGAGTNQAKYRYWFEQPIDLPGKHLAEALIFADSLIGFAVNLLKRKNLNPDQRKREKVRLDLVRARLWGAAYQPFAPILADDSADNMPAWEQSLVDLVLDAHWENARPLFKPADLSKNELALMAWIRDNRKWVIPNEAPQEPGVGRILRQRGMKPAEFNRLLGAPMPEARATLAKYGIDTSDEKIEKLLAAWASPRESTQRRWMRDYYYQPKKEKGE